MDPVNILVASATYLAGDVARKRGSLRRAHLDIQRDREPMNGIEGARKIHSVVPQIPIVFYIENLTSNQVPEPAMGITNEPNELLHLVLDRLRRSRS